MISVVRKQTFVMDRNIAQMKAANSKLEAEIKKCAKSNKMDEAKILAKELVSGRKTVTRMQTACTQANCLISQLNGQIATMRMAGSIKSSTEVMKSVSTLVRLPEFQKIMQGMSKEMMKLGIINEMIDDTMESTMSHDADDLEEATQAEVNRIMAELATKELSRAPTAIENSVAPSAVPADLSQSVGDEDREEIAEMQARLAALRN